MRFNFDPKIVKFQFGEGRFLVNALCDFVEVYLVIPCQI